MKRFASRMLLLGLCLVALASCKRIPLYDPEADVYLKLNIKQGSNVMLNEDLEIEGNPYFERKVYGKLPERVRACFYDVTSHKLVAETFLPPEGGFIEIAAGTYDLIVYSLGTEITRITGTETRAGGYAYTDEMNTRVRFESRAEIAEGVMEPTIIEQKVIREPDHLFAGRREGVVVPVHSELDKTVVIECDMESVLETYSFEVRNVVGAERIADADVYITGQAPSRYLWDLRRPNNPVAIYFQASINEKDGRLYTIFNTFGKYPGISNYVFLNVRVQDTKGNKYQWVFDVTDQFDNPDNFYHEIIVDEKIEIPEDGSDAGGLDPKVKDWEIVHIPLVID